MMLSSSNSAWTVPGRCDVLKPPQRKDWQCFYEQTAIEGWRVPQLERQLFQGPWKDAARVLETDGVFCGMVTAVPH